MLSPRGTVIGLPSISEASKDSQIKENVNVQAAMMSAVAVAISTVGRNLSWDFTTIEQKPEVVKESSINWRGSLDIVASAITPFTKLKRAKQHSRSATLDNINVPLFKRSFTASLSDSDRISEIKEKRRASHSKSQSLPSVSEGEICDVLFEMAVNSPKRVSAIKSPKSSFRSSLTGANVNSSHASRFSFTSFLEFQGPAIDKLDGYHKSPGIIS